MGSRRTPATSPVRDPREEASFNDFARFARISGDDFPSVKILKAIGKFSEPVIHRLAATETVAPRNFSSLRQTRRRCAGERLRDLHVA